MYFSYGNHLSISPWIKDHLSQIMCELDLWTTHNDFCFKSRPPLPVRLIAEKMLNGGNYQIVFVFVVLVEINRMY